MGQTAISPTRPSLADEPSVMLKSATRSLNEREMDVEDRLSKGVLSGAITRASFEMAEAELNNIRVQEAELAARDGRLNATDRDFIGARITALEDRIVAPLRTPAVPVVNPTTLAPAMPMLADTPGTLTCNGKRVLLSVGRDHATAAIQRSGDENYALIAEAVASPYQSGDSMTLRVTGPGLNAKVDGARAGQYLLASTTTNFSLKSKQVATIVATVVSEGGAIPQYVKVWGSCSRN
jgi:hypothetical protein